ncbi:MAG: hypothetical protein ABEJ56_03395 [Candidatus Nanohaloarchaea archaeon]
MDITIDGTSINNVTIDGTQVQEVTIDGNTVWTNTGVVEDFPSGSLSKYTHHGERGSSYVELTNSSYHGTYACLFKLPGNENGNTIFMLTTDVSVSNGKTYEYYAYVSGGEGHVRLVFGVQSESSFYSGYDIGMVHESGNPNKAEIRKDGGDLLRKFDPGVVVDEWSRHRLDWGSNGSIRYRCYDSNDNLAYDISQTDNSYSSGGIGWVAQNNETSDNIRTDYLRSI